MGKQWKQWLTLFFCSKITADGDGSHEIKKCLLLRRKVLINLDSVLKSRDITLPTKVHLVKAMFFQWLCMAVRVGLYKESWVLRNWCFWTVVLEKTLESPLDCKEIQPVHPKGDQSGVFIGRADVEAETPILWPPDVNSWLIWKDPDAGKDWGQEEKWTTEDEMVGWHHQLDGHEFEQASGVVMDRDAYCATVHGVAKSWTRLSDWVELRAWSSPECSGEPKECLGLRSNRSFLCFRKITLG